MLPEDYDKTDQFVDFIMQPTQFKYSLIQMLESALLDIQDIADYVYLSDTRWQTNKGFGFIE